MKLITLLLLFYGSLILMASIDEFLARESSATTPRIKVITKREAWNYVHNFKGGKRHGKRRL